MYNMEIKTRFFAAILSLISVTVVQAQHIGVNGRLANATTREPIKFATVIIQTAADSVFVNGTTSDKNGIFSIGNISSGHYRLVITSVGFDTVRVELPNLNNWVDTGLIPMNESASDLSEVVVEGMPVVSKSDRKLYFVSESQRMGATNGMNLINRLNMPRLVFNPYKNSVTSADNKNIELRINDVPATNEEILALQPKDITRIEYIDNPGLKYGAEAGYVLNYIVQKRLSGGSAGIDLNNSINRNFHQGNAFVKVHRNKSQFSASGFYKSFRLGGLMRTNKEIFRFEKGNEWVREEIGQPTVFSNINPNGHAAYNYTDPDKRVINATLRFYGHENPCMDFVSQSFWHHKPHQRTDMKDLNNELSYTSMADIYYMEKLKNEQTLIFNLVYSNRRSKVGRNYSEMLNDKTLTDISTRVNGNRNAYIGEFLYEKTFASGAKFTGGIRHRQSYTRNNYSGNVHTATDMVQYDSYLYSEFSGKIKEKTDYVTGIALSRIEVKQENVAPLKNYFFQPRIRVRHHFNNASHIGVESRIDNRTPSLSQLSAVCQAIDSLQKQCGNPNLKSWITSQTTLNCAYNSKLFDINAEAQYQYMHKPVMSEKLRDKDGIFVHSYDNQKYWRRINFELSAGCRPFGDYLSLQVTAGHTRYVSAGNRYLHRYNDFYHTENIILNYKRLTLSFMNQRAIHRFFGEETEAMESIHIVDFTYTHPRFSAGIMVFNPFTKTYQRDSENFSSVAPRQHTWYSNKVQGLTIVKFAYNLRWGEEYKSTRKRISNSDSESGILSGGK